MNTAGWASLLGVVVSALAAMGVILNNSRTAKVAQASQSATAATEAQRLALEGLETLVHNLRTDLTDCRQQLLEALRRLATVQSELDSKRANEARLLEQVGLLELQYQEGLGQLEAANERLARLEAVRR